MGLYAMISTRDAIISAARSLDKIISINKKHRHLQQQYSYSDQVQVFLQNDDTITLTSSTTYDDIAYAAEILLDPNGSSQTGRALLMQVKPGTQAGVLLHQPQQSQDTHDVIECDLRGNNNLVEKRQEQSVAFNHVNDESSSYVEGFPQVIEAWLLSIAIRHLQRNARCADALSLCSKSIGIVSEHIHTIETMSPTPPQKRASNEERTSLLLLHHRFQTLQSSMAKDCVTVMFRESSDGTESVIEHSRHGRSSHRHRHLSSLRQNLDSRASILNLQLRELSHDAESTTGRLKHDEDGVLRGRRGKKDSNQWKKTKTRHFLYPQLLCHPGFY